MKKILLDQHEFESSSSEEALELHVAMKRENDWHREFKSLREFLAVTTGPGSVENLGDSQKYNDVAGFSSVRKYLKRFAQIEVPDPCDWKMFLLYEDDLEWDGAFESPDMYIRYHWLSTA